MKQLTPLSRQGAFIGMAACLLALCAFLSTGCNREEPVRKSQQPKETQTAQPMPQNGMPPQALPAPKEISWQLPAGWTEDPTPRMMRVATIRAGEGGDAAELVVSQLSGTFGSIGDNINRWRGQVGLDPAGSPDGPARESPTTALDGLVVLVPR